MVRNTDSAFLNQRLTQSLHLSIKAIGAVARTDAWFHVHSWHGPVKVAVVEEMHRLCNISAGLSQLIARPADVRFYDNELRQWAAVIV